MGGDETATVVSNGNQPNGVNAAEANRRSVSADSFRRLTALLKKPGTPSLVVPERHAIPDLTSELGQHPSARPAPVAETPAVAESDATPTIQPVSLASEALVHSDLPAPEPHPSTLEVAPAATLLETIAVGLETRLEPAQSDLMARLHADFAASAPTEAERSEHQQDPVSAAAETQEVEPDPNIRLAKPDFMAQLQAHLEGPAEPEPDLPKHEAEALQVALEPLVVEPEDQTIPAQPDLMSPLQADFGAPAQSGPEPEPSSEPAHEPVAEHVEPPLHAAYDAAKVKRSHLSRKAPDDFAALPGTGPIPAAGKPATLTAEQEAEKAELARSLLDMMAAGGGQPQERALAADTLLRMLPQLPARTRLALAQRLTIMDAPPPFLISRLIADPDQNIAAPLLEDCSHISDEDLFAIIETGNVGKCRMLARRRKVSPPIAEALAKVDDTSVLLTLVRNPGAEISPEGFLALAGKAKINAELLAPLCTRADLPVHFAFELFWAAPAQLRRYLFSRFLTDSENLTKILKITMGSEVESIAAATPMDLESIGQALESIMEGNSDTAAQALATAAKVNLETVRRILADTEGEPLMALLKVVGVPRSELEKALPQMTLGTKPLIDSARNLDEVQSVFDQLSFNKARILLTYWNWSSTRTGPYAPQH